MEEWCAQITRYLNEPPKEEGGGRDRLPGPRSVLEHWRGRMTRLTSITEQLKLKECKNVLAVRPPVLCICARARVCVRVCARS